MAGFKTFVAGATLPASELNGYLMQQANIICTSGTRPASPIEGMLIYETDTNLVRRYNGTDWATETMQVGSYTITFATGVASATVTFPIAFTAAPIVVPAAGAITGNTGVIINVTATTTTTFTYRAEQLTSGSSTPSYNGTITGTYHAWGTV